MKLTLLGTSHGVPSDERYTSCYMLEVGEKIYLFDGGAPVADLFERNGKKMTDVKGFFNTHFHGDHVFGALQFLSLLNWYQTNEADIDIMMPDEKSKEALKNVILAADEKAFDENRMRFKTISPGIIFDDGIIKVEAIQTMHISNAEKKSYAFYIEAEGKNVLYTGDMSFGFEFDDFPKVAFDRHIDVIISECAHFPAEKLAEYMNKVNTDIFVVSHIYPVEQIETLEKMADSYDFELLIAEDGDEIEF